MTTTYTPEFVYLIDPTRDGRSVAQAAGQSGQPTYGLWAQESAYQLSTTASVGGSGALTLTAVSALTATGFVGTAAASGSGVWFLAYQNSLTLQTSAGTVAVSAYSGALSGSGVVPTLFTGLAAVSGTGPAGESKQPFFVSTSGTVFTSTATAGIFPVGSFASALCPPLEPTFVTASGGMLLALLGQTSGVGTYTVTGNVSGFIAAPFANLNCLNSLPTSGGILFAVGGWNQAAIASGFNSMTFNPAASSILATTVSAASAIQLWTVNGSGGFSLTTSVVSAVSPQSVTWSPNGNFLFAPLLGGNINVYSYSLGVLNFSGVVTASGLTTAIAFTSDSTQALTTQPALNTVTSVYLSAGTQYTSGVTFSVNSAVVALNTGNESVAIGFASGIIPFTYTASASAWASGSASALVFTPYYLTTDIFGNTIAAGTSGATGNVYVINQSQTATASAGFAGTVSGLIQCQAQIVVQDSSNSALRIFEYFGGTLSQQSSAGISAGAGSLAISSGGIVLSTSIAVNTTKEFNFTAPWTLAQVKSGVVGIYSNSTWVSANLGPGFNPTAIALDTTGNVYAATANNYLFVFTSGGAVSASGVMLQQTNQLQSVPLGISSISTSGSLHVYAGSILNEATLIVY